MAPNGVVDGNSPTPLCNQPTISAIGRTICTAGFSSAAIAASCFTALDLWHRHDEVGRQHGAGQPQMIKASIGGPRRHFAQFIAVEIHEADPLAAQLSLQAALSEHEIRVSLMAGS